MFFLTKEKETRVKRWSAFEQLRPAEHLLRQQNKKFFFNTRPKHSGQCLLK